MVVLYVLKLFNISIDLGLCEELSVCDILLKKPIEDGRNRDDRNRQSR